MRSNVSGMKKMTKPFFKSSYCRDAKFKLPDALVTLCVMLISLSVGYLLLSYDQPKGMSIDQLSSKISLKVCPLECNGINNMLVFEGAWKYLSSILITFLSKIV